MSRRTWMLLPPALCGLALLTAGCAGYRVGPVTRTDYKSVAVPMFKNNTLQPRIEAQITNAILKRLQADGSLRVESRPSADVVVVGEITRYERTSLRSEQRDTSTPSEYRITITARVEARDSRTGRSIIEPTDISGRADTFIGSDLQSAELQVLPLVADDLARQVVSLLVESW